jgi:hypothetical protein
MTSRHDHEDFSPDVEFSSNRGENSTGKEKSSGSCSSTRPTYPVCDLRQAQPHVQGAASSAPNAYHPAGEVFGGLRGHRERTMWNTPPFWMRPLLSQERL